jgi:hypothetical protein
MILTLEMVLGAHPFDMTTKAVFGWPVETILTLLIAKLIIL